MLRSADRLLWTVILGVPLALLTAGFAGFLRLATARRRNIAHLPKRRQLTRRAS
jgi:uncharacterized protein involved in exopolysaccharide biosynthesis